MALIDGAELGDLAEGNPISVFKLFDQSQKKEDFEDKECASCLRGFMTTSRCVLN
jgi:hypothetical protein